MVFVCHMLTETG